MRRRVIAAVLLAFVVVLAILAGSRIWAPERTTAGSPARTPAGDYTNVSPAELREMLSLRASGEDDFALVDVHVPNEGYLDGTDARVPFDEVERRLGELPAGKDDRVVLYCRSGRMSAIAADTLVRLGYRHVHNLEGGYVAWEQAGLPVQPE